jgi:hypothetical protein
VATVPAQNPPRTEFVPVSSKDVLVSSHAIEFYPITVGLIRPQFGRLGIYLNPGCQPIEVLYRMRIGGQVQTSRPVFELPGVCRGDETDCQLRTLQYFEGNTEVFVSAAAAAAFYTENSTTPAGLPELIASIGPIEVNLGNAEDDPPCIVTGYTSQLSEG